VNVEFLTDAGDVLGADDDVVELGRAQLPRWAVVVGCAAALLGFFALAALKAPHPTTAAEVAAPTSVPVRQLGPTLPLGAGSDAVDVLVSGDRLYVLRSEELVVVGLPADRVIRSMPLADAIPQHESARLVIDEQSHRIWVFVEGVTSAPLLEFDATTLRSMRRLAASAAIYDAAAMDGHLYLATSAGLADVAPGAVDPVIVAALRMPIGSVAAYPAQHQILVISAASPAAVVAVSGGRVVAQHVLEGLVNGSLAVIDKAIWAGGFGTYGALLARLEPATLAAVRTSPVAAEMHGAIVAAGERSLWVVSTRGAGLWCLDPVGGEKRAFWPEASSPVASRSGVAYVVDRGRVRRLALPEGCAG
jgi:hypothetical protein